MSTMEDPLPIWLKGVEKSQIGRCRLLLIRHNFVQDMYREIVWRHRSLRCFGGTCIEGLQMICLESVRHMQRVCMRARCGLGPSTFWSFELYDCLIIKKDD